MASQLEHLLLRELDRAGISPSWHIADSSVHCQSNRVLSSFLSVSVRHPGSRLRHGSMMIRLTGARRLAAASPYSSLEQYYHHEFSHVLAGSRVYCGRGGLIVARVLKISGRGLKIISKVRNFKNSNHAEHQLKINPTHAELFSGNYDVINCN